MSESEAVGFARWLLARGYAIGSVNGRLSTVKTYCRLAMQAGALNRNEYAPFERLDAHEPAIRPDSLAPSAACHLSRFR